jgi:hypothetical protein
VILGTDRAFDRKAVSRQYVCGAGVDATSHLARTPAPASPFSICLAEYRALWGLRSIRISVADSVIPRPSVSLSRRDRIADILLLDAKGLISIRRRHESGLRLHR